MKLDEGRLLVLDIEGRVRISAPLRMDVETIRLFAVSKLSWIKQQQKKIVEQERETPREYVERESHYLWNKRYLLKVVEEERAPHIELKHTTMVLHIRPGTSTERRSEIRDEWYRAQLRAAAEPLIAEWEPVLGVKVNRVFVQRMKTKWASCNHESANIRLNTELAKKPAECLEYIVLHEMAHIIESTHNKRFINLLDRLMPNWRHHRQQLNRLPVRHESWEY